MIGFPIQILKVDGDIETVKQLFVINAVKL